MTTTTSKRVWIAGAALALGVLITAAPSDAAHRRGGSWGETQALRVQVGILEPRADSDYFDDKALDFDFSETDFEDNSFGVSYVRFVSDHLGVQFGVTGYEGAADPFYLDFVEANGANIAHSNDLELTNVSIGLMWNILERDRAIIPYLGVGGGLISYDLIENGDFIDFGTDPASIFTDQFAASGDTFGYYVQAGLEVPLGDTWSIFAEAKWNRAEDDLEDDFEGFGELDLSYRELAGGFSWSF